VACSNSFLSGQIAPICMTSVHANKTMPAGQWTSPTKELLDASQTSTAVPSGACSDVTSEVDDEEENTAQACGELTAQIEAGGVARAAAIEALLGSVQELAFDADACRVVQRALELAEQDVAAELASEMKGCVREAIESPHANHVIQKILDVLPACQTLFIVDEVVGFAAEVARHRYGCRVLCRIVERHSGGCESKQSAAMICELLVEAAELSRHTYSHYVMESILQHGTPPELHAVSVALCVELLRNAKNRSATYVVERAVTCCSEEDRQIMISELFGTTQAMVALVENQFGCHVAKALVRLPGGHLDHALTFLDEATPMLQKSKYGRRVLEEFRLKVG